MFRDRAGVEGAQPLGHFAQKIAQKKFAQKNWSNARDVTI